MDAACDARSAYQRYGPALRRQAERLVRNREDALDVVQGLFADVLHRGPLTMDFPYLHRAVTNRCLNLVRDRGARARLLAREDAQLVALPRGEGRALGLDLLTRLADRLDRKHLEVLVCRFVEEMGQEEIATHLAVSRKTVGKRLQRIQAALHEVAQ